MSDSESTSERPGELPSEPLDVWDVSGDFNVPARFLPEDTAPSVDHDRVRRYARRELSDDERLEVRTFIANYKSWFSAWRLALLEEWRKRSHPRD